MDSLNPHAVASKSVAVLLALLVCHPPVLAENEPIPITLEQYINKAIQVGIDSKLNNITLQSAGYTRDIVFRQTDSPTFTLNHADSRSEKTFNGFPELGNSQQTSLTMNETTPLGTTISAATAWAYFGGTEGPSNPIARPGFSADVTQPIYIFVKNPNKRARQGADLNFANAKSVFRRTILSLRSQARSLYYNVMLEDESIQSDARKVASSQKLLSVTEALVDAGKSAPVETMRAKIQLQADQRQFQNDQVLKEQSLLLAKDFAQFPLNEKVRFVTALPFIPLTLPPDSLLQYAILHNPNLETLRADKDLARLDYEAAIEPTRPTFSLNGTYSSTDARTNPDLLTRSWSWTSTMNWLFFDSFVTRDRARNKRIAQVVADMNLINAERSVEVSVTSDYLNIKRAEKQIEDFKFSKDQAQRNVEVLRVRFQNGLTGLLDVLNAEDQMKGLDNEYLRLLVQFNASKDQLSEQLGTELESLH